MESRTWTSNEIRELIQHEVASGNTMGILTQCIANGSMTESITAIANAASAHVNSLTAQAETNAREIDRVLTDCRTFVDQTQKDSEGQKERLKLELDALQERFRDLVALVDKVPKTVEGLDSKLTEVESKLTAVTDWCGSNRLDAVPVALTTLTAQVEQIQADAAKRFGELTTEISITRSAVGHGSGTGGQGSA